MKKLFNTLFSFLVSLSSVVAWASPQVIDMEFKDVSRDRTIPIRVRIPDVVGKVPLVIFSHGLGGSRDGGKAWGEHWAANGYFVIHTQHPGSDVSILKTGSGSPMQRLKREATAEQLIARTIDVRFVLDEVTRRQANGDATFSRIDLNRIAMTGHSFGAMTTVALADAKFTTTSRSLADPRFKAFIAFSPQANRAHAYDNMKRPFLTVTGTLDGDVLGNGASADRRAAVFDFQPAGDKYRVIFENGDHMVFNGGAIRESDVFRQLIGDSKPHTDAATAAVIHEKTKLVTLKFLDAYLKDDASAKSWLTDSAAAAIGAAGAWAMK